MAIPPTAPSVATLDAEGRIASDLACVRCGYNLRGLTPAGLCPECGTSIEHSLHGEQLAYADPDWVARLTRGAVWTVRGINCILLTWILLIAAGISMAAMSGPGSLLGVWYIAGGALLLFGVFSLILGYWWLTQPDPGRPDEDEDQRARQMGRIGLLGAPIVSLLTVPLARLVPFPLPVTTIGSVLIAGLFIVGCVGFFGYLARLARRIPDAKLAARSLSIRKGLVVCIGLYAGMVLLMQFVVWLMVPMGSATGRSGSAMWVATPGCFMLLIALALLFYLNRVLRLLMEFRKQLQRILEQARRNWNASGVALVPPISPDPQP